MHALIDKDFLKNINTIPISIEETDHDSCHYLASTCLYFILLTGLCRWFVKTDPEQSLKVAFGWDVPGPFKHSHLAVFLID